MELAITREWGFAPEITLENTLASADGAFAVDGEGRIIYWNDMAEQILGFSPEEVLGRQCSEVMSGVQQGGRPICCGTCIPLTAARRGQMLRHDDLVVRHAEGRPVAIRVSTLALRGDDTQFQALVHVMRDVAREKRVELLLYKLVKALEGEPEPMAVLAPLQVSASNELTRRELQVLRLLAKGAGTKAVAEHLSISAATARHHIDSIMSKLGVHSRLEAVAHALRHQLIEG